jgi:hypothetical protein
VEKSLWGAGGESFFITFVDNLKKITQPSKGIRWVWVLTLGDWWHKMVVGGRKWGLDSFVWCSLLF